jgi:hypothetical protein
MLPDAGIEVIARNKPTGAHLRSDCDQICRYPLQGVIPVYIGEVKGLVANVINDLERGAPQYTTPMSGEFRSRHRFRIYLFKGC